jgi:HSP20 family molecular chaperone IbpA
MEAAASYRSRRVLAEIDPHSDWVHGDEFDTLIVDVSGMHGRGLTHVNSAASPIYSFSKFAWFQTPKHVWDYDDTQCMHAGIAGFTKNQLKVQVEPSGSLRISGERAVNGGRQWSHFLKRFDLPAACDAAAIKVQLDKGMLYVQVPCPSAAADDDDSEEYPEHTLPAEEEHAGVYWSGGHTAAWRDDAHPGSRLAKNLGKHRYVILNVVLGVVLLWLMAFAQSRQIKSE